VKLFAFLTTAAIMANAVAEDNKSQVVIRVDQPGGVINRNIYGQFSEHLGRCIYEGIWVGQDSPIPNTRGIRNDVVAALKKLNLPVLRWPGGCFADEYHWKDGIGPREKRTKMINTTWGGGVEDNSFGTHEFMDLCEQIGCEPYICGNLGSGTPQEMMEWVEYMTSDANSPMANLRRQNGHDKPWKVRYFGVGNENWGCGGNMRPEFYSDNFRRYNTFVKNYGANRIQRIACGSSGDDLNWTEVVMKMVGSQMDGLSLHWYSLPTGSWDKKGAATGFGEDQWHSTLVHALHMEELVAKHSAIMDKTDPQKKIGLVVDEWGTWYDPEPVGNPGVLYQQNSLRDAVVAGITLNIFNRHCDRVHMANISQLVNVLQALILTDKEKMIVTPTYHVFELYKVHQDATCLPVELTAPDYTFGTNSVPSLHASASRDKSGRIHLSLVNLDPQRANQVNVKLAGASAKKATGQILTAPQMDAHNTFENPEAVKPAAFSALSLKADSLSVTLPSKSIVVLEIE